MSDDLPPIRGTASFEDNGTEEQREAIRRLREAGWLVTVWPSANEEEER